MLYSPLFPAGLTDAALICVASGRHFGRVNDLLTYRHDDCVYHPVESLVTSLPRGCRLSRRPAKSLSSTANGITKFYLDGHLIGMQITGRPHVCLLMSHRVAMRVGTTSFHWRKGQLHRCFLLLGSATVSPAAAYGPGHLSPSLLSSGRTKTESRSRPEVGPNLAQSRSKKSAQSWAKVDPKSV